MSAKRNLLVVISDEHAGGVLGIAGHPIVKTPNLDALARRGAWFSNAYCNVPVCVPSRASLATGRYAHQIGHWDNAMPYAGRPEGWAHAMREAGYETRSIGKLHYRSDGEDSGFGVQDIPMHVKNGKGDLLGSIREPKPPVRSAGRAIAERLGAGETNTTRYDRDITARAVTFLKDRDRDPDRPFLLHVGFVAPHFPLIAPEAFFGLYDPDSMPLPKLSRPDERPTHPWLDALRESFVTDSFFDDEKRRIATAAYFGLCSFVDDNVGQILAALDEAGLSQTTDVIYTSDHGDNLGARGLWQKNTLYEESARIPLIMAGEGLVQGAGRDVKTGVSLVDIAATGMAVAGCDVPDDLPGRDLGAIAAEPDDPDRVVFSEYHGAGAISGAYMIRWRRYKLIHYAGGLPPMLFDLADDPEERRDLGLDPTLEDVRATMMGILHQITDPERTDARAKADQRAMVEAHGGAEAIIADKSLRMPGGTPPPGQETAF
ncbi:MAG: sulfatase-like hydrolase/transferase [Pseudomonadota bacterium]